MRSGLHNRDRLPILGLLSLYFEALVVVIALGKVLAKAFDHQQPHINGSLAARGQPYFAVHGSLLETKARPLLHGREQPSNDAKVVDEAYLEMRNLASRFVDPHRPLQLL